MAEPDDNRLSLIERDAPPEGFELRVVAVPPGERRRYEEGEWRDALVVVERGEIALECNAGGRRCFEAGTVLWFDGLPLRSLHNPGSETVVLSAMSRA